MDEGAKKVAFAKARTSGLSAGFGRKASRTNSKASTGTVRKRDSAQSSATKRRLADEAHVGADSTSGQVSLLMGPHMNAA
jgi:hypothetical protein